MMGMPILKKDPQNAKIFNLMPDQTIHFFLELIRKIEGKILIALDFQMSRVLSYDFLVLFFNDLSHLENNKKVFDFAHFLLLLVTLNSNFSCVNRCLAAFSVLYLSNRFFGDKKQWPKLKNSFYSFVDNKIKKDEGIYATLHLFSLIKSLHVSENSKKQKGLVRKKSFTDMLINKINNIFKNKPKKEHILIFDGDKKGKLFDFERIERYCKDEFVGFSAVDEENYTLELAFSLKKVKKISVQIFSGRSK
jgi:hypothetical protein